MIKSFLAVPNKLYVRGESFETALDIYSLECCISAPAAIFNNICQSHWYAISHRAHRRAVFNIDPAPIHYAYDSGMAYRLDFCRTGGLVFTDTRIIFHDPGYCHGQDV